MVSAGLRGALSAAALATVLLVAVATDDAGGFFTKSAAKSVPRLGRRGDFYTKGQSGAAKTVPRIGKKSFQEQAELREGYASPVRSQEDSPKPVYLVRYARDMRGGGGGGGEGEWSPSDVSWEDIDQFMEDRPDLWRQLLEAGGPARGAAADRRDIWQRHYEQ